MNAAEVQHRADARRHAIRRARQRHGIRMNEKELATLEERLRAGEGKPLRTYKDGRRIVRIRFLFDYIDVVFDPVLDCIKTVLTRGRRELRPRPSKEISKG